MRQSLKPHFTLNVAGVVFERSVQSVRVVSNRANDVTADEESVHQRYQTMYFCPHRSEGALALKGSKIYL